MLEILLSQLWFDYLPVLGFSADQTLYTVAHDISKLSYIGLEKSLSNKMQLKRNNTNDDSG